MLAMPRQNDLPRSPQKGLVLGSAAARLSGVLGKQLWQRKIPLPSPATAASRGPAPAQTSAGDAPSRKCPACSGLAAVNEAGHTEPAARSCHHRVARCLRSIARGAATAGK